MFEKSVDYRAEQARSQQLLSSPSFGVIRSTSIARTEAVDLLAEARAMGEGDLHCTGTSTSDYVGDTCAPYLRHAGNTRSLRL